jgi:hypothetical protein
MADVKRAKDQAVTEGLRLATVLFFTVLLDKEQATAEILQRVWREVEDLADSVAKGYVSVSDLAHVLREEYGVGVWQN